MSCSEYEEMIYTFHEAGKDEQDRVRQHIESCDNCKKLFDDVKRFSDIVKKVGTETGSLTPPINFAKNVTEAIEGKQQASQKKGRALSGFELSFSRYALAAVSCGILVLFFSEILVPDLKSGKIKGPISSPQGAIIKSEDFRKVFTKPKEKKSLFDNCKNILSQQIDVNCVREKLDKINF